jgi:hypothetical protein
VKIFLFFLDFVENNMRAAFDVENQEGVHGLVKGKKMPF